MFTGFSDATIDFLWELRFHNERPWFLEHKQVFVYTLDRPMKALAADVTAALEQAYPQRKWYLHVARIYRDARRLHGNGPYKESLWFTLRCDSSRGPEIPAFYFEITPHNYSYGMGCYWAKANTMACFRRAIDADPLPLTELAERLNAQSTFVLAGQDYVRPKGNPGALLSPWYNKRVLDLSCVRAHDDPALLPRADGRARARVRLPAAVLRLSRGRGPEGGRMMRSFDGHCDTLARCLACGGELRQNAGHVDLTRCAALGRTRRSSRPLPTAPRQVSRSIPSRSSSTRCSSANVRAMPISCAAAARRGTCARHGQPGKRLRWLGHRGRGAARLRPQRAG